ncbi:hypothetical protein ACLEJQ_22355 [Pseudomonas sp. SMV71]|uniref:hypothetical protein n=1 Tax=Pseudomonas sp. SMV71 TaxID=3390195 RepID=UPI003F87486C
MNDRELLELAAKAVNLRPYGRYDFQIGLEVSTPHNSTYYWNPLGDDGDAFRLAVDLDLDVGQAVDYREVQVGGTLPSTIFESWGEDKIAATRRAIVRGAAEIGKARE